MTIVDPTKTDAWTALKGLADGFAPDLRAWLADPERVKTLTLNAGDLHVDLSKNLVTDEVIESLLQWLGVVSRRGATCCAASGSAPRRSGGSAASARGDSLVVRHGRGRGRAQVLDRCTRS